MHFLKKNLVLKELKQDMGLSSVIDQLQLVPSGGDTGPRCDQPGIDQLQLVPSGGDTGPRRTSPELKLSVIYMRVQCPQKKSIGPVS
jgi:hypothetical protein